LVSVLVRFLFFLSVELQAVKEPNGFSRQNYTHTKKKQIPLTDLIEVVYKLKYKLKLNRVFLGIPKWGFAVRFCVKCLINYYCNRSGEESFKIKTGQHCFTYNPYYISYRTLYYVHFMREWFKIF